MGALAAGAAHSGAREGAGGASLGAAKIKPPQAAGGGGDGKVAAGQQVAGGWEVAGRAASGNLGRRWHRLGKRKR